MAGNEARYHEQPSDKGELSDEQGDGDKRRGRSSGRNRVEQRGQPKKAWHTGSAAMWNWMPPPAVGSPTNESGTSAASHPTAATMRAKAFGSTVPTNAESAIASSAAGAATDAKSAAAWSGPPGLP